MSDDELRESPLSPADDERVRRLLAQVRHTEPLPAEVAARLEGVLAGLVSERRAGDRVADAGTSVTPRYDSRVVDLAARRRKTVTNLLVAAAAVVVLGVGISQVLPDGLGSGDDMGAATQAEDVAGDDGALQEGGGASEEEPNPEVAPTDQGSVTIRSDHFGADVRRARAGVPGLQSYSGDEVTRVGGPREGCVSVGLGPGVVLPAVYDGAFALLVLRPPAGEVQVADLYLCGDTEPRRSITLTAR